MGFLADCGQTLDFFESQPLIKYIKKHGIIQFLLLYRKFKDSRQSQVFWGDEIEFHLLNIDPKTKSAKLQINTDYLFNSLKSDAFNLQPEFGSWMIETVPNNPYKFDGNPLVVLQNMELRRKKVQEMCNEGDVLFAGTAFPLMGVGDYFVPRMENGPQIIPIPPKKEEDWEEMAIDYKRLNPFSHSQFVHDEIISCHPRFPTSVENVRQRRGEKVKILAPIYQDENTVREATKDEPYPGFIYMDALHFGMGSGCLQVTFGAENVEEARYLTDQLAVLSSIMLPMTAATAILKGKLADIDVRWSTLSASVDCRTNEERDPSHPKYIAKSRYSSISQYISDRPQCKEEYNDIQCPMNEELMRFAAEQAQGMGVEIDGKMLKHLGCLFARDPLVVFPDKIYVDDQCNTNHFENLQSTNWNSVRFKPPPSFNSDIGWRVELRTPENQLTSEENVACAMFAFFIVSMIKKKEYNLYIPISKVDENIERGHKRDAILKEKFWFRKDIQKDSADEWVELTIDEILHGKADVFVGLMSLIYDFCKEEYGVNLREWKERETEDEETKTEDEETKTNDNILENARFLNILSKRAKGEMPTIAAWVRNFVLKHPKYQKDSVVSSEIGYDLVCAMMKISNHEKKYEDFM